MNEEMNCSYVQLMAQLRNWLNRGSPVLSSKLLTVFHTM